MDESRDITRRRIIASSAGIAGIGALCSGSAAAEGGQTSQDSRQGVSIKALPNAITVANGKAKVKGWARSSKKAEVTVDTENGSSTTYTATDFAEDINAAINKGLMLVRDGPTGLEFDLTAKGRRLIGRFQDTPFEPHDHCDGKSVKQGDTIYLDDDAVDELVVGGTLGAGVFTVAAAIVGYLTAATLGPILFVAAGVLIGAGATSINLENDGCGIKIDTDSNSISSQHCDC